MRVLERVDKSQDKRTRERGRGRGERERRERVKAEAEKGKERFNKKNIFYGGHLFMQPCAKLLPQMHSFYVCS